jgi:RNA polymerase sigma factor (TIGR02999 family)
MSGQLTVLLQEWQKGDKQARDALFEQVYELLKQIAGKKLQQRAGEIILQPTVLVNEAFIKLSNQKDLVIQDRKHFFAISARVILQIIIDYRKQQAALIRGGDFQKVSFSGLEIAVSDTKLISLTLQEALDEFAEVDERAAYVFQLKHILGFTVPEICEEISMGQTTVEDDLRMAKAWLSKRLR